MKLNPYPRYLSQTIEENLNLTGFTLVETMGFLACSSVLTRGPATLHRCLTGSNALSFQATTLDRYLQTRDYPWGTESDVLTTLTKSKQSKSLIWWVCSSRLIHNQGIIH